MKDHTTQLLFCLASLTLLTFPLSGTAQVDDCNYSYTLTTGCAEDGTGWAVVSNITSKAGPFTVHWNGSEAAGSTTITGLSEGEQSVIVYDIAQCGVGMTFTIDCGEEEEGCQFRTQTQGGWGTTAHGHNPGTYRDAHFAAAFPTGLEIGCTNTLRLSTSEAVRAFLPSGSNARSLNAGTLVDPGRSYRNVLAGQLVALTLSVRFDAHDASFGASAGLLSNALIVNGTFQGWSIQMLLNEANNYIGGCGSAYSASQINAGLSMVNENFVDGTTNNGNVDCMQTKSVQRTGPAGSDVLIYPNPAQEHLVIQLDGSYAGNTSIVLHDARGRVVLPIVRSVVAHEVQHAVELDLSGLPNGAYVLVVDHEIGRHVQQVIIAR